MISSLLKSVKTSPLGLMAIIFAILCIGLISLYSVAEIKSNDASNAFLRQIIFLGPALLLMLIFTIITKKLIHEYIYILYALIILMVILPFFGTKVADTYRWINFG